MDVLRKIVGTKRQDENYAGTDTEDYHGKTTESDYEDDGEDSSEVLIYEMGHMLPRARTEMRETVRSTRTAPITQSR